MSMTTIIEQLVKQDAERVGMEVELKHGPTIITQRDPEDEY